MSRPSVLDRDQIKNAPYLLATRDLHVVMSEGDTLYARGFSSPAELGAHYNVVRQLQLGLAAGIGLLREPGTPDFRALLRIAYAPIRAEKAKPIVVVDYGQGDGWNRSAHVRNVVFGYELDIQSVELPN